jgi:hypothetical protein
VDEQVNRADAIGGGPQLGGVRGVEGEDAVGFGREAAGGRFRGNEAGDVPAFLRKKIRASFAGVAAASEDDARMCGS